VGGRAAAAVCGRGVSGGGGGREGGRRIPIRGEYSLNLYAAN
jgi:hypothetical protein